MPTCAAVIPDGAPRRFEVGPLAPAWLRDRTSVAALAAPITRANGSVFGALVVTQARRKAASHFGDNHTRLLGDLADQASMAIENGLLFIVLELEAAERAHEALHDPLTGLPNHARLSDMLETALQTAYADRGRVGLDRDRPRLLHPGGRRLRPPAAPTACSSRPAAACGACCPSRRPWDAWAASSSPWSCPTWPTPKRWWARPAC